MPTTTETTGHLEGAIKGGAKAFPLPGLNAAVKVRYSRGGAPVGIFIYGVTGGLYVTPVDNGAGRPPKSVNKFLAPIEITPGNLKKYANYAHKVHKYLENGGKAYAEHWDINGSLQGFKSAPANVYAVHYVEGASPYELVQASTLVGKQSPACGDTHEAAPRAVSAEPTTKKEDTPMKKYTAAAAKNNGLAEAVDTPADTAGIIRTVESGQGLRVNERAELISPAIVEAMQETPPVFLKLSHYSASNTLHIQVTGGTLTPVVIADGTVCSIGSVEPIEVGEDVQAAIIKLLKVMRPVNKAVNAKLVELAPVGAVAGVPVAA